MKNPHRPPALILCAQIAALALTRRLGQAGVRVGLIDAGGGRAAAALRSRYVRWQEVVGAGADAGTWMQACEQGRRVWGPAARPALIATSDETLLWMSRQRAELASEFRFLLAPAGVLEALLDKRQLQELAQRHGLAVPRSIDLGGSGDLAPAARALGFPCLLKSAYGKLGSGESGPGKVRVESWEGLRAAYARLATVDARLMLQEYISGGAERVALYNAYFNAASEPVAVFTGRKLRQYPLEFGTASRSEACAMAGVAEPLTAFLQTLGYAGPVDIGLKWDERQGCYKLLDVNPRLGQNYRTFIGEGRERADLGWLAYRELAEGGLAAGPQPVRQRRRVWKVASHELRSCRELWRRGELSWAQWMREWWGFRLRPHEGAYWSWRDPMPALVRVRRARVMPTTEVRVAKEAI